MVVRPRGNSRNKKALPVSSPSLEPTLQPQDSTSEKSTSLNQSTASSMPQSRRPRSPGGDACQPSRWNTPEFYIYYAVWIVAVPMMFLATYELSKGSVWRYELLPLDASLTTDLFAETNSNYPLYEHLLSPGWLFGRKLVIVIDTAFPAPSQQTFIDA